jgi:hypothetical protein
MNSKPEAASRIVRSLARELMRIEHESVREMNDRVLCALMRMREDLRDEVTGETPIPAEAVAKIMREDFSQPLTQRSLYSYHRAALARLRGRRATLHNLLERLEKHGAGDVGEGPPAKGG